MGMMACIYTLMAMQERPLSCAAVWRVNAMLAGKCPRIEEPGECSAASGTELHECAGQACLPTEALFTLARHAAHGQHTHLLTRTASAFIRQLACGDDDGRRIAAQIRHGASRHGAAVSSDSESE